MQPYPASAAPSKAAATSKALQPGFLNRARDKGRSQAAQSKGADSMPAVAWWSPFDLSPGHRDEFRAGLALAEPPQVDMQFCSAWIAGCEGSSGAERLGGLRGCLDLFGTLGAHKLLEHFMRYVPPRAAPTAAQLVFAQPAVLDPVVECLAGSS